jgi:cell division protein FtsQ
MNTRIHIIIIRVLLSIGVAIGGLMLLSAVKTKDAKPCSKIIVHYQNGSISGFVPETQILSMIEASLLSKPVGSPLAKFDLKTIELELEKHPWVYDAQLYFDNTQSLHVKVQEAVPVARGIDGKGNHFYLDKEAAELPLSINYRANLPVFTNLPIKREEQKAMEIMHRVCRLSECIVADSFWLAQAAQIDVLANGKMELIPAVGNHIVELGFANEPKETLQRLKYFYQAMAAAGRFDEYQKINASFAGQIVAQRSGVELAKPDKVKAMNTYQKIVNENKHVVNANSVVTDAGAGRIITEPVETKSRAEKEEKKAVMQEKKAEQPAAPEQTPAKPPEKIPEQKPEVKEVKVPKAVMPKIEKN